MSENLSFDFVASRQGILATKDLNFDNRHMITDFAPKN